jgi:DNA-binding NarL/FixJ family response regulator/Tfp pilus assembly protein PilF
MQQQLKDWRYVTNRKVDYSDKRVLLIDSSGNVRSAIFHMLRRLGVHNIQAASINDRVFSLISEGGFDLILLGHNGSDTVSGIQVLEEARYRGYMKPSAGWVFMTSDASQEMVLHAIDSRPDVLLTKPFSIDELKLRLDTLVGRKMVLRPVDMALEMGDLARAIAACDERVPKHDPLFDFVQQVKGKLLIQARRFQEARVLSEARYWQSQDKEAGLHLAEALAGLGQLRDAVGVLEGLIEHYPLLIGAYDLLAIVHERLGELPAAREALLDATTRSPMSILRQMELGRVSTQTRNLDTAEAAYRKSIVLGRHSVYRSPEPFLKLANLQRMALADADARQAVLLRDAFDQSLNQALFQFPRDSRCKIRVALLRRQLFEDLDDGLEAERMEREAETLNRTLETPLDLKREQLRVSADKVPLLEPETPQQVQASPETGKRDPAMSLKVNRLGVKHYRVGKVPQALRYFGMAIDYDPTNGSALLNLAQLFLESARDTEKKREERLRMVDRYLHLAASLSMKGDVQARQMLLQRLRAQPIEQLPQGSLGALLR